MYTSVMVIGKVNEMFENKILRAVAEVTANEAYFYEGTMFVDCDARIAAKIESFLLDNMIAEGIMVCKVGSEFAFDFV